VWKGIGHVFCLVTRSADFEPDNSIGCCFTVDVFIPMQCQAQTTCGLSSSPRMMPETSSDSRESSPWTRSNFEYDDRSLWGDRSFRVRRASLTSGRSSDVGVLRRDLWLDALRPGQPPATHVWPSAFRCYAIGRGVWACGSQPLDSSSYSTLNKIGI